ncbi:hypothetical protein HPB51_001595 [Rhipicephalus microplus]|uniref:Calcineurin-like phosphoesterase domain-containing protein n=1 Tax=Rhipicephalus microplus TaxID=6941 RepID=A0A9J6EQA6_RHIMP|nr:hypothetical protein HPB51_001595 [Rhipicephalus microplus]
MAVCWYKWNAPVAWHQAFCLCRLFHHFRGLAWQVERAYAHWSRMPGVSLVLQLGDLIDFHNAGCGRGLDRVLATLANDGSLPTYHTLGNHELYNCTRRDLVRRYVCPRLLPNWTPPATDDPVFYYSMDLLAAIYILALAWEHVKATTVHRCFHHAGFQVQEAVPDEESPADADIEAVFSEVMPSAPFTLQDYESIDENFRTCRKKTVEEMIAEVQDEDQLSSE